MEIAKSLFLDPITPDLSARRLESDYRSSMRIAVAYRVIGSDPLEAGFKTRLA